MNERRNVSRILELADWLQAGAPERNGVVMYHQGTYSSPPSNNALDVDPNVCGSVCCIAGTAAVWWQREHLQDAAADDFPEGTYFTTDGMVDWDELGARALGLDYISNLFSGSPSNLPLCAWERLPSGDSRVRPQYAARVLRHLAATGEINWINPPCE